MANEIKQVYITGASLTAKVYYDNAGTMTLRDDVGALTEEPASSGVYKGSSSSIVAGDVVVTKNAAGVVVGGGEYRPSVSSGGAGAVVPAGYVGDYKEDEVLHFLWHTNVAPSADGTIKVYKNNGTDEVTLLTGITDSRDFDSKTGVHLCSINLSVNSFYANKRDYLVVLSGATIDGATVNAVIATFSIENRYQGWEFRKDS